MERLGVRTAAAEADHIRSRLEVAVKRIHQLAAVGLRSAEEGVEVGPIACDQ